MQREKTSPESAVYMETSSRESEESQKANVPPIPTFNLFPTSKGVGSTVDTTARGGGSQASTVQTYPLDLSDAVASQALAASKTAAANTVVSLLKK